MRYKHFPHHRFSVGITDDSFGMLRLRFAFCHPKDQFNKATARRLLAEKKPIVLINEEHLDNFLAAVGHALSTNHQIDRAIEQAQRTMDRMLWHSSSSGVQRFLARHNMDSAIARGGSIYTRPGGQCLLLVETERIEAVCNCVTPVVEIAKRDA